MQLETDELHNTKVALIQNNSDDNSKDDSDYEEKESDGSEMEDDMEDEASYDPGSSNAGWADVMQKILKTNKPKRKKTLVLAKAKKLCDVKIKENKEDISFEVDGVKEEIKTEPEGVIDKTSVTVNTAPTKSRRITKKSGIRVKPSITDREHERMLQKIATK